MQPLLGSEVRDADVGAARAARVEGTAGDAAPPGPAGDNVALGVGGGQGQAGSMPDPRHAGSAAEHELLDSDLLRARYRHFDVRVQAIKRDIEDAHKVRGSAVSLFRHRISCWLLPRWLADAQAAACAPGAGASTTASCRSGGQRVSVKRALAQGTSRAGPRAELHWFGAAGVASVAMPQVARVCLRAGAHIDSDVLHDGMQRFATEDLRRDLRATEASLLDALAAAKRELIGRIRCTPGKVPHLT